MKLDLVNASVVVLADQHNPTILHPSFLESQGIVRSDWKVAEPVICTPPFARVIYTNGIQLTAEPNKFQVVDGNPPQDPSQSVAPDVAAEYTGKLPYVKYTAVGINFTLLSEREDPESFVIDTFLKSGPWGNDSPRLDGLEVRLFFPLDDGRLRFVCAPGKRKKKADSAETGVVVVSGNYHADLTGSELATEAQAVIHLFSERFKHFTGITKRIFGLRD